VSLPLGGGGVTPQDWWLHQGAVAPVSTMATARSQTAMTDFYKGVVKASPGYQSAKAGVWDGLDPSLPLPLAIIAGIVQRVAQDFETTVENVEGAFAWLGDTWQDVLDFLGQGADGTANTGRRIAGTKTAIASLRDSVVTQSAAIARLGGYGALDGFNRTGPDLGPDWTVIIQGGAGGWGTDGTAAVLIPAYPNGTLEVAARWDGATAPVSSTDYQQGTIILGSAPGQAFGLYGYNDILLRCDASPTIDNYVRARVGRNGTWVVAAIVANSVIPMFSGTVTPPGAAGRIEFFAGELATENPRKFCLRINDDEVLPFTDEPGEDSLFGEDYRGYGHGGRAESVAFSATVDAQPGSVNQWSAMDQLAA
jgi:hypothetical protein